jgi:hypothetical protein
MHDTNEQYQKVPIQTVRTRPVLSLSLCSFLPFPLFRVSDLASSHLVRDRNETRIALGSCTCVWCFYCVEIESFFFQSFGVKCMHACMHGA